MNDPLDVYHHHLQHNHGYCHMIVGLYYLQVLYLQLHRYHLHCYHHYFDHHHLMV